MSTLGIYINTSKKFEKGTILNLDIKLPFAKKPFVVLEGAEIQSKRLKISYMQHG